MDVHQQETQVCIEGRAGAVVLERIRTTRERFTALLGGRPRARVLLESATESEWVAQHLEGPGHEVIVADPNYALIAPLVALLEPLSAAIAAADARVARRLTATRSRAGSRPHRAWGP